MSTPPEPEFRRRRGGQGDDAATSAAESDERNENMGENADEAKGRVKEAAGDLTDDQSLKNEGKVDRATSTVKDKVGDASDKVKDVVNPDDK
jgi:uncharacterized protein YjbJ (UPF0337 family)